MLRSKFNAEETVQPAEVTPIINIQVLNVLTSLKH